MRFLKRYWQPVAEGQVTMERPGWRVTTRGRLRLSADAAMFHLVIDLTALHDDEVVFTRSWEDDIPRVWA